MTTGIAVGPGTGSETWTGGDGDDTVQGGNGNDTLIGGAGADELYGGSKLGGDAGNDTASYAGSDAGVNVDLSMDTVVGVGGDAQDDTLEGIENLIGSAYDDTLTGGNFVYQKYNGENILDGGAGNDSIYGGSGNDTLRGGDGNDTLDAGAAGDTLVGDILTGGAGADVFKFDDGHVLDTIKDFDLREDRISLVGVEDFYDSEIEIRYVTISNGYAEVRWSGERIIIENVTRLIATDFGFAIRGDEDPDNLNDSLAGGVRGDTIIGGEGNDTIDGRGGNDTLEGGIGNDTLTGGAQNDLFVFAAGHGSDEITDFKANGDADTIRLEGVTDFFGQVTISDAGEDATLTWYVGTVSGDDEKINGTITFKNIDHTSITLRDFGFTVGNNNPDNSNDTITGNADNNVIYGLNGNDSLVGLNGDDAIYGGIGDDTLEGGADDDTLRGGGGNDTLQGDAGNDRLYGFRDADLLDGNEGDDWLNGGAGADTITGGLGNDTLIGQTGEDTLDGDDGDDSLSGNLGNDILRGGVGEDTLRGGAGDDTLDGGADNDTLTGFKGDDMLVGNAGNDLLKGGDDNDTLSGGIGDDELTGGAGNDSLIGFSGNDTLHGGAGADVIEGGDGNDTASYARSNMGVTVDLSVNGNVLGTGGHAQGDTLTGIENLIGSDHADSLTGNNEGNILEGGGGDDTFVFASGHGSDTIKDFADADTINITESGVAFSDLTVVDAGDDASITWSGGTITLENVDHTTITEDDFTFG